MKIAFISTNTIPTPSPANLLLPGWTTSAVDLIHDISEGMVRKGHDVTLFASGNSKTNGKLESVWGKSSVEYEVNESQFDSFYMSYEQVLAALCYEKNLTEKYDIIYSYHTYDTGIYSIFCNTPIIATVHGPGSKHDEVYTPKIRKPNLYVGISDLQIKNMPYLKFTDRIYHGIDKDIFKYKEVASDRLVIVGRITEDKGTDIAVEVAREMKLAIDVIGTTMYKPLMDKLLASGGDAVFHGQQSKEFVNKTVSDSKAFIFPVRWDEPFGLVLVESLACGTPIIGFANGALPEIIKDGETGFLINYDEHHITGDWTIKKTGVEGLKEALNKLYSLNLEEYKQMRKNCRESFEKRFTKEIMIDNYEKLFERIINEIKTK